MRQSVSAGSGRSSPGWKIAQAVCIALLLLLNRKPLLAGAGKIVHFRR